MRGTSASRLAFAALGCGVLIYMYALSAGVGKSSDQANLLLAGIDMLHGNLRLRGWSMVADNYWTSDVALGAVLSGARWLLGLREASPVTLVFQPALSWTLLTLTAVFLTQREMPGTSKRWCSAVVVLAAMGVPVMRPGTGTTLMLLSGIHILTILYALLAVMLGREALAPKRWRMPLAGMAACLTLGVVGDPLMLFIGVAPILIVAAIIRVGRMPAIGAVAICSALAAKLLLVANIAAGGFDVASLPLEFARFDDLGRNIGAVLHGLLVAFSADFTGRQISGAAPDLLHLPLLVCAVGVVGLTIARMLFRATLNSPEAVDFVNACLAVGAALDVAALLMSQRVEYENGSFAIARYLFPAWIFGSVVLARHVGGFKTMTALSAAALSSALAYNFGHTRATQFPALNADEYALLEALEAQPVRAGLAGYWQAGLMQVASGNELNVEACIADATGHLKSLRNANKEFSLGDISRRDFFVVVLDQPLYFDTATVIRTFGQPDHVQTVSDYRIMFYHGQASG